MPSQKMSLFNASAISKQIQSVKGIATSKVFSSPTIAQKTTLTPKPTHTLAPTPTPPPEATVVTYTDTGFSPKLVSITKGETITFKNTSETDMWVASNYFPTSKLYPGTDATKCQDNPIPVMFDECEGVTYGKSWSFEFDEVGKWPYHNHLKPDDGGTITVTAE